jgi:RNA polymerase sigma-70 factor, ECF subfamily
VAQDIVAFFQEHFPIVRAKCARILGNGDDAADVAQEAFLRLCSSPVVHEPAAVRLKWIYVTGTRLCIDHVRRRRLGIEIDPGRAGTDAHPGVSPNTSPAPEAALAARQALERLSQWFSPEDLAVLVMTRSDRMTQDEVAAALDMSSRQVRRVLERADAKLAALAPQLG